MANRSPWRSIARVLRAFLAAIATTAFQLPARPTSASDQRLTLSDFAFAAFSTARAP